MSPRLSGSPTEATAFVFAASVSRTDVQHARRDKLATNSGTASPAAGGADDVATPSKPQSFASLGYEDLVVDEDDDDGGLMAQLNKASKGGKDKKKKKKQAALSDDEEEVAAAEPVEDLAAPRGIVEVGADDWMEEEFGKDKPKKGKKGGKKQQKQKVESEDEEDAAVAEVTSKVAEVNIAAAEEKPTPAVAAKDEGEQEEPTGVLSKKEKERIKKEKEKVRPPSHALHGPHADPSSTGQEKGASSSQEGGVRICTRRRGSACSRRIDARTCCHRRERWRRRRGRRGRRRGQGQEQEEEEEGRREEGARRCTSQEA